MLCSIETTEPCAHFGEWHKCLDAGKIATYAPSVDKDNLEIMHFLFLEHLLCQRPILISLHIKNLYFKLKALQISTELLTWRTNLWWHIKSRRIWGLGTVLSGVLCYPHFRG